MVITGVYFSKTISVKITPVAETVKLVQTWNSSHLVYQFQVSVSCDTDFVNSPLIIDFFWVKKKKKPEFIVRKNKWLTRTKGGVVLIYRFILTYSITVKATFKNKQLKLFFFFFFPSGWIQFLKIRNTAYVMCQKNCQIHYRSSKQESPISSLLHGQNR